MSNADLLIEEIKTLPEKYTEEVLDFVGYLKEKEAKYGDDSWFEKGEGCPICAKYRDPVTGEERFNAETIAAFEEGDAMMRGEIPTKWTTSGNKNMSGITSGCSLINDKRIAGIIRVPIKTKAIINALLKNNIFSFTIP